MTKKENMHIFKGLHIVSLLIGALTIALPLVFWSRIPDRIPMHYNAAGAADSWSDKSSIILLFFMVGIVMGVMCLAVYFVKAGMESKYSADYKKSEMSVIYPMLIIMNLIIQIMFAYLAFCCVTCRPLGVFFLPVFLIGIFVPIGYMIYKCGKIQGASSTQKALYKKREREEDGILYRSAVDWWLGLILIGTGGLMLWFTIEPWIRKGEANWFMILTTIFVTVILAPLFAIKYVMYSDHLLISMGFYGTIRVGYGDILEVKKTMNPLSSAAMSLKRIQIDYVEDGVHRMVLISPKKREIFLKELEERRK